MKTLSLASAGTMSLLFAAACSERTITDLGRHVSPTKPSDVTSAAFSTVDDNVDGTGHCQNGNPAVNCNIYDAKNHVWLNGGPIGASLGDGTYFFAVLAPGGQPNANDPGPDPNPANLSAVYDAYTNRTFTVTGGVVSYSGTHDQDGNKIRLVNYADTPNPGGVYILAICVLPNPVASTDPPGAAAKDCKFDAFKVLAPGEVVTDANPPTVTKDAAGAYTTTWTWGITKDVDKTLVKISSGSATFNYTVSVTHDAGTNSGIGITGKITVFDSNVDVSSNTVAVDITGVGDTLSDGTACTVTGGGAQTISASSKVFSYSCSLSALPSGSLTNTVTVSWADQLLLNGDPLAAGSATFPIAVNFSQTKVDDCVSVSDTYDGSLGTVCSSDASPTSFTYSRSIPAPVDACNNYPNTATFTTNTSGTTGSAGQSVEVCGPAAGGLTMGFWQNKNGQGIITGGASTAGVCNSGTWLRLFAPFQDLSATASCSAVGTYVTTIIKAANASGAAMNAMLKAQMLATALDVYFSDPTLGTNKIGAPLPLGGVNIDLTSICKMIDGSGGSSCSGTTENTSSAFNGKTALTVLQLLNYAASQSDVGGSFWYGQVKAIQGLAKDTFDAINNGAATVAP